MSFDHLNGKSWWLPQFSRQDAENFLAQSPVGTFKNEDGEIFHARILCIRRGNQYVGYSIGGDSEVFSNVDALLKRVQPKTKLLAPQPGMMRESVAMSPAAAGRGGSLNKPGAYPPPNMMPPAGAGAAYPNPHLDRSLSGRGGVAGGAPQPFNPALSGRSGGPAGGPPPNGFGGSFGTPNAGGGFGGPATGFPPANGFAPPARALPPPIRSPGMPPARPGFAPPARQQAAPIRPPVPGFAPDSALARSTQIDMSELQFDKEIGAGSFGTVYKGQWKSWTVAIKQLKNHVPEESDEYKDFVREAELMTKLRPHDNVVRFVGVTKPPNLCIVLEFVARGSLYDLLQSDDPLSGEVMLVILKGVCAGMAHLHEENVVHRDLAARNVLLDHNLVPKLGDFGMSRVLQTEKNQTKSDTGPLKWMAPESIKNREYSRKSDVWAFAVVITEVLTRCSEPYPDLEPIQVATRVAYEDLKPPVPPGASQTIVRVLQACSERDPAYRPEFQSVCEWLNWERTVWAM